MDIQVGSKWYWKDQPEITFEVTDIGPVEPLVEKYGWKFWFEQHGSLFTGKTAIVGMTNGFRRIYTEEDFLNRWMNKEDMIKIYPWMK